MADYCTVAEVKAQIDRTSNEDDAVIRALIPAASQMIDRFTNRPTGFLAEGDPTPRYYPVPRSSYLWIDDAVEILSVGSRGDYVSDFTALEAGSWYAASGDPGAPNFNVYPYNLLFIPGGVYPTGGTGSWWSARDHRNGRPPRPGQVEVVAVWGYSREVPPVIKQAAIITVSRWYKRGEGAWGDSVGDMNFGKVFFNKAVDPDVQLLIEKGRFVRPATG